MKKRQPDGALALPRPAELDLVGLLRRASPVLLVVGVWLAFHPYTGIVHDARLYGVMALRELHPDTFAQDLFFVFGSQDDFTLFTSLFAPLVELLGLHPASLLAVAVGQTLWLSGASMFAVRLAPNNISTIAGLVLLVTAPTAYGGGSFAFGEGIATPRIFAEGLTFWALYALIDRRLALATCLAVLVALLHPLMGLAAIGVGWFFLLLSNWRWSLLAIGGLATIAVAAIAGIAPFDQLGQTVDAEWLGVLEVRVYYLFPSRWSSKDWTRIVAMLAIALSGSLILSGLQRRVALSTLLAALTGILVTVVGADILKNVFFLQIQPYRVLWILSVVSYIVAGFLLVRLWRTKEDGLSIIALLVFTWLVMFLIHPVFGAICNVLALALAVARLRGTIGPLPFALRVASKGLAIVLIGLLVFFRAKWILEFLAVAPDIATLWRLIGFVTIIDSAAVAIVLLAFVRSCPGWARRVLPVVALLFVVASTAAWDRRDDWTRMLTRESPVDIFGSALARDATVYWDQDVRGAWLLLQRPSYVSMAQGAGLVFNRATALEYRDRANILAPLAGREFVELFGTDQDAPPLVRDISIDQIISACRNAAGLDAIVLAEAVDNAYAAQWRLPKPIYDVTAMTEDAEQPPVRSFYLYRCADLD